MATGRTIPVRVGDTEILVETVAVSGTEPTSGRAQRALNDVDNAFNRAQEVIVEVAKSTAEVIERAAAQAARPDRVEIEFGLNFSATGGIIMVVGATAGATLRILLAYDTRRPTPKANAPQADSVPHGTRPPAASAP